MPFRFRSVVVFALTAFLTVGCGDIDQHVEVRTSPRTAAFTSTFSDLGSPEAHRRPTVHPTIDWEAVQRLSNVVYLNNVRALRQLAAKNAEAARHRISRSVPSGTGSSQRAPASAPPMVFSSDLSGVVQCIKNHESGNYSESSHIHAGSGAFQFIPDTWRTWQARWKASLAANDLTRLIPDYSFAYQAPAWVQDAVLAYALTHGGAGNWSMRWGNDPCTRGLPGGG